MNKKSDPFLSRLDVLARKIEVLTTVTAAGSFKDRPLTESIAILLGLGLEPSEIARILGTKSNIVRATKSKLTKKGKGRKRKERVRVS